MGGIFSKKSRAPSAVKNCEITDQDKAILQLKTQRDKIKQLIKRKEKLQEKEREMARQLLKDGRKDRALLLLKKKKYQETIIEQSLKQLDNIERMVQDLELADMQQRVVDGLRVGNEALKKMNALFDFDEIEKIMDETKEAAEYQEEISNLLSGQLSSTDVADVEQELEALLASQKVPEPELDLPEAPTDALKERERENEEKAEGQRERTKKKEAVMVEA